jgi:hypothetical protein
VSNVYVNGVMVYCSWGTCDSQETMQMLDGTNLSKSAIFSSAESLSNITVCAVLFMILPVYSFESSSTVAWNIYERAYHENGKSLDELFRVL